MQPIYIACAGWSITAAEKHRFPMVGTQLERYASVLPSVEINSSFYRPHRPASYARWRDSVPDNFRFSIKMPRTITHERRLKNTENEIRFFLEAVGNLNEKFGCLLVQLPPSLQYDPSMANQFFGMLRSFTEVDIVCEPRHITWFSPEAAEMLFEMQISYVRADPSIGTVPEVKLHEKTRYVRLHGSPVIYHSAYSDAYLTKLSEELIQQKKLGHRVWCIFDNTANGAAMSNALNLLSCIAPR